MIEIKPNIEADLNCPICQQSLLIQKMLWQGIHVCVETHCTECKRSFISDLPVGHGVYSPFHVEKNNFKLYGERAREWLGVPFQKSIYRPSTEQVEFIVEKKRTITGDVVILNCIDYLYGHSLLKLLNASRHIAAGLNLVVIVPAFLMWCVPRGVSEIWTVDIKLKNGQKYYTDLDKKITNELKRFNSVYVSKALAHPRDFNILEYSKVHKDFSLQKSRSRVLFVWREDRLWNSENILYRAVRKLSNKLLIHFQKILIVNLFRKIRHNIGLDIEYIVAGLGTNTNFPEWVADYRVEKFDAKTEKELCSIYAQADVVIGVHGSNMLLPSAHARMSIDLMPKNRWGNFAQDILYQETDIRMASWRYRYLPIDTSLKTMAYITTSMLTGIGSFQQYMVKDYQ